MILSFFIDRKSFIYFCCFHDCHNKLLHHHACVICFSHFVHSIFMYVVICICILVICVLHYINILLKKKIISSTKYERDKEYMNVYGGYVSLLDIRKDLASDMYELYIRDNKSFESQVKDKLELLSLIKKVQDEVTT